MSPETHTVQLTQREQDYIAKIPVGAPPPFLHHLEDETMSTTIIMAQSDLSMLNDATVPATQPSRLLSQVVDAWARGKHRGLTVRVNYRGTRSIIGFAGA